MAGANVLGRALFPHLFPENGPPLNHTRYLFLDDRAREFYLDWERAARHLLPLRTGPGGGAVHPSGLPAVGSSYAAEAPLITVCRFMHPGPAQR